MTFDAADLAAESAFWAGILGGQADPDGDLHMVTVDGTPRVGVQLAPDHVAPDWPNGTPKPMIHLDLWVEDFPTAPAEVMALGARVLQEAHTAARRATTFRSTRTQRATASACAG